MQEHGWVEKQFVFFKKRKGIKVSVKAQCVSVKVFHSHTQYADEKSSSSSLEPLKDKSASFADACV